MNRTRMSFRMKCFGSAIALAALVAISPARAQSDKAAAQALFEQGMQLAREGAYATACPKFEESLRLEPSLGSQYYLADCYEHAGRTASAWAHFVEVGDKARLAHEASKERR